MAKVFYQAMVRAASCDWPCNHDHPTQQAAEACAKKLSNGGTRPTRVVKVHQS